MNKHQAQIRLKQLSEQILAKGNAMTGAEAKAALAEWDECEASIKAHNQALRWASPGAPGEDGAVPAGAGDPGGWSASRGKGVLPLGPDACPLVFSKSSLEQLHQAVQSRQSIKVKAFASAVPHLPPELSERVVGPQHEDRLIDHLPVQATTALSWEYIRHTSTSGQAGVVAEGAAKPELVFVTDKVIAPIVKVAAQTGVSYESIKTGIHSRPTCTASCCET